MKAFSAKMSSMVPGKKLRPAEQTGIVEADDIGGLIRAIAQFEQRGAGIKRHGVFDARDAAHLVQDVVGQRNGIGDRLDRRVHHPNRGADVDDGRRRALENPGEKRRHLDHQEHGEGDPDQKRCELRPVVDQKPVSDPQDPRHRTSGSASSMMKSRRAARSRRLRLNPSSRPAPRACCGTPRWSYELSRIVFCSPFDANIAQHHGLQRSADIDVGQSTRLACLPDAAMTRAADLSTSRGENPRRSASAPQAPGATAWF